jgi:hypothetical protein
MTPRASVQGTFLLTVDTPDPALLTAASPAPMFQSGEFGFPGTAHIARGGPGELFGE